MTENPLLNAALTLVGIIALLAAALVYVRKYMPGKGAANNAAVIGRIPLPPKAAIAMVRIADRVLVVGITEANVSLLTEITDPAEVRKLSASGTPPADLPPTDPASPRRTAPADDTSFAEFIRTLSKK